MNDAAANARQVAGTHYRTAFQHWDLVAEAGMGYFDGQVTKYVSRWRKKNGLQDLEKAKHFAEKYYELLRAGTLHAVQGREAVKTNALLTTYIGAAQLDDQEAEVVMLLTRNHDATLVKLAIDIIDEIIDEIIAAEPGAGYVKQD